MKMLGMFNQAQPLSDSNPAVLTIVATSNQDILALAALQAGTQKVIHDSIAVGDQMGFEREVSEDIGLAAAAIAYAADALGAAVDNRTEGVQMANNEDLMRDLMRRGITL